MLVGMSRWWLILSLLAACGGDDSGGGDGGPGGSTGALSTHGVTFPNLSGNVFMNTAQWNHRMMTADGARVHSIGSGTAAAPHGLYWFDDSVPVGGTTFAAFRAVTSMQEDGAGGVFLLGDVMDNNERCHPAVAHFGADGKPIWAKSYTAQLPQIWGIDCNPNYGAEPGLGPIVDGKLPVIAGGGVMVLDTSGAVQWATVLDQTYQLSQVTADGAGLVVFGMHYYDALQLRFDWSGALTAQTSSVGVAASPAYAMRFGTPVRAGDGTFSMPYSWRLPAKRSQDGLGAAGILVFGADGAITDNYSYEVDGEEDPMQIRAKIGPIGELHILSPDLVQADFYYNNTFVVPPLLTRSYFVISADAKKYSQVNEESVAQPDGDVMMIRGSVIGTDTVGDKCSYNLFEINSMTRVAGVAFPAFTPIAAGLLHDPLTPTVADLALNATDAGAPTTVESSNACRHVDTGS